MNKLVSKNFLHEWLRPNLIIYNFGTINGHIFFLIFGHFPKFLNFLESYPAIIETLGSTLKDFGCPDKNNKGPQLKLEVCI